MSQYYMPTCLRSIDILAALLAAWRVAMETPLSSTSSSEMMAGHESLNIEKEKSRPENAHPNTLTPVQSKIEHFNSRPREFTFIAIICMAQLMTQAALGQAIAPLHIIGSSFGVTNPGQLSWFAAAYSLTVGTFIIIAGRLGDLYGHKLLFISGFFWFALWSLLAGFSAYSNAIFFDVARALQGIGPAFLLPNALAILARIYEPGRKKEMIFSLFGATAPTGFTLGATFSSIFAEFVWWPWAYWVTAMVCVLLAIVGLVVIPHTPPPQFDRSVSMFKRADGLGALTGVAGLVLVNFSWNQGPVIGWTTVYVYVILIIGALVLGLFAFIESRAPYPLVPFGAFNSHTGYTLACIAGGWASFGIWIFYFWQLLEEIRGSVHSSHRQCKVPASTVMMIAMTGFLIGSILMATVPINQTYWAQTFVACVVTPWGMDMSFPAATILLSDSMHKDHQGLAASLVNTVVNYSISIGLGIAGTVEVQINNGGKNPKDLLKGYRGAQRQSITNSQSPSTSSQDVVDRGILDPLRSRYMSQHSAVAFPRSLGVEFQSANPPPLHSFAWNCGIRAEEAASAHTNLTQLVSFDDFKRFSDIYAATVHGPFGFLDWPYFMRRRLRLMKQGLEKEAIQSIIDIGNKGAEAADTFARNGHPWWNILSTTFQYFCVLLAIDTSESLSNVSWVLNIFENIVRIVDTHLAHEALDTAKVLLRDSMAKKRRDLGFLENADGQHGPETERQVDINWDALLDPTFPDALMSEEFSIYNN
ncbi:Drug resistance protein YOR378W-like 3 [Botrytis cinerea]